MASKKLNRTKLSGEKATSERPEAADIESPTMQWLMNATKAWCNAPSSRKDRTIRKKMLGEIMGIETQSVKNFYNQGQIKSKHVFLVLEIVSNCPHDDVISFFENYAYFKNKLNDLPAEKRRLFSLIAKLNDNEIYVLNELLEAGLQANKALRTEPEED